MTEMVNGNVNAQKLAESIIAIEAMVEELEAYIIDNQVYRTLLIRAADGNHNLQMSGGDLLARIDQVRKRQGQLSPVQQDQLKSVEANVQRIIYSLRTPFHELLRREVKSRHDQLEWNRDVRRAHTEEGPDAAEIDNRQRIAAIQQELNRSVI